MQLAERARDLRHRVAEIAGGLTGPQDYELDGAILAAFEELCAAAEAAAYARAAVLAEQTAAESVTYLGWWSPDAAASDCALRIAAAIRALT